MNAFSFHLPVQLLIGGQISSTLNLFLTVIILRLFHHDSTPEPKTLRFVAFKIIAPMVIFDVGNVGVGANSVSTVISETAQEHENPDDKRSQEAKSSKEFLEPEALFALFQKLQNIKKDEMYRNKGEWQLVSRVLDRVLFVLNLVFISVGFAYGYITIATD